MTQKIDKQALIWLNTAHLTNDAYSGFLNPLMPFIAAKIGFSMAIATLIMSLAQIFASMFQPIFGFFADNMLKRAFIFWGLLFGSIFVPIGTNAPNAVILTICVILGNLGGSFFHPQALGYISRFAKENFIFHMGIFISCGTIGYSIGPLLAAVVTQHLGLEKIPYLSIIGVILAFMMFKFVPKISNIGIKIEHKNFAESFKNILSNKYMLIIILISMMKTLIANSATILLPFLWKNLGHTPIYIGTALFLFLLAGGIASLLSSKIERKLGAKNVFYFSMIITCPLMIGFLSTYKIYPHASLIFFVLMGFATMLAQPVMIVMAQRLLPDYKSIVSGFINGFSWGVVAVFLTIIGYSAEKFGIGNVLMLVSFIPVVFSYFVKFLPKHV